MSEPSQEPSRIGRARAGISRWRSTRRGTKTLKAAYQQAARDVKRMDPAVRERIGRANMTKADLQMLADTNVARSFRPDRYGEVAQGLEGDAAARVQAAGTSAAPTRNPIRRLGNRISRWRNTRQGTKALKAAYQQAARDVKRMDPSVREAIGRSTITKADLQALSQGHMDQVFRPEGRLGAVPGQQQMLPPEQEGQQQAGQVQQLPSPQQLMQPQQDRTMELMAEINQLQAQAAQLLQIRIAQLEAEAAQLQAQQAQLQQQAQVAQQLQPEAAQQQPGAAQPPEAAQQQPGVGQQQPAAGQQQPEAAQVQPEGAQQQLEGAQQQPEGVQQPEAGQLVVAENLDHVGVHPVVPTREAGAQQPAPQGPDPNDPQHWVDTAAGRPPAQPEAQVPSQEGSRQQAAPGEAAKRQGQLTPADMQNHHAAYAGLPPAKGSTENRARETAAAAEKGLHKAGQGTERPSDSINR